MKFQYLGTAACEGIPGLFCSCDVCEKSRNSKGRNFRSRTQAIVNDSLLIDFPPDTFMHSMIHGLDMTKVKNLIITHNHFDHLFTSDFTIIREKYAYLKDKTPLTVYGTIPTLIDIRSALREAVCSEQGRIILNEITSFKPFKIDDFTIVPLKANHNKFTEPNFFDISDGKKRLLYANDTGIFPDETWDYLNKCRPHYDIVSLDCTSGINSRRDDHMGIGEDVEVMERLISLSCADMNTKFILHHFSHNGGVTYDEFVPIAKSRGFDVSYDGMVVKV